MNAEDLYWDREDLMTPEELEEWKHDPSDEIIQTLTPNLRSWLLEFGGDMPVPDMEEKEDFLRRKPAMSATPALIAEARKHYHRLSPYPVQQRRLFKMIRSKLLRQLIPCSGVSAFDGLMDILQSELDSGIPSPIPDWYEFPTANFGPRDIGYRACENRSCFNTDTVEKQLDRCAKCKLAYYCSRDCQVADWKARHKQVCKKGSEFRDQTKKVADLLSKFQMMHNGR